MSGEKIIGYWYCGTRNYFYHISNEYGISDDESLEVYVGDGRRGHRSLGISKYSSINRGVYHSSDNIRCESRSQETSHSFYKNIGVYNFGVDGRGETRSQDTIQFSHPNRGTRVDVDGRCGYMSQTRKFSYHNPCGRGILLS